MRATSASPLPVRLNTHHRHPDPRSFGRGLHHGDQEPTPLQHTERPFLGVTAKRVEDNVNVFGGIFKPLGLVVDKLVGPQSTDVLAVRLRCSGNHMRSFPLGELNGHGPNAARGRMDENGLTEFQACGIEKRLPCRKRGDWERGGMHGIERFRRQRGFFGFDDSVFGKCAQSIEVQIGENLRARVESVARFHGAGDIAAENQRKGVLQHLLEFALANVDVDRVNGRGRNLDE